PAAVPARLPNADLTWEENKKKDIGLDFGLFQNRLTGTIDLYHRKTNGLIYPKNVSYTTGFSGYQSNIGNITNKGFEIMLSGDVLQYNGGKLNLFGSYSNNANKITNLYDDDVPQTLSRFKIGEPVYTYFMVRWAGVNPSTGRNMYYTKDGQLTETYSSSDAVLLSGKTPQVKYYGSFGLQATYKGFELSTQFYYSGGNYIMNYVYSIGASEGESVPDQQYAEALHYWKKPGDIVRYANLNDPSQRITYDSDKYLEKGDYVSLRDVTLAYTTPSIKVTEKFKIKSLRFYVQGTNLAIWTKFKGLPEVGEANNESGLVSPGLYNLFAQPQLRAITTGIDIRF
ncbi:MAG: TonB-dependent receptor, partial [Bacteroidetes bacterium]|nr:TonB-dependent receptor [Bacteroidota bacterium]